MDPIKEALTFDDVLLTPKYSEILPSEVTTNTSLSKNLNLKIFMSQFPPMAFPHIGILLKLISS